MYKMQQQLGSFAKHKSREELETPSYTTTVPALIINDEAAWIPKWSFQWANKRFIMSATIQYNTIHAKQTCRRFIKTI